jgi:hypothetical protein
MRKLILMAGLVVVGIACGDAVGEMMDSGVPDAGAQGTGGTNGSTSLNWTEVTCDSEKLVNHYRVYKTECVRDAENNCTKDEYGRQISERVELNYEIKTYQPYASVTVNDVARVYWRRCGEQSVTYSPPLPPDPGESSLEYIVQNDSTLGECWTGAGNEHTENTVFYRCAGRTVQTHNQPSEYCTRNDCTDRTSTWSGQRYFYAEF